MSAAKEDGMTQMPAGGGRMHRRPLALVNAFTRWILHVPLLRRLADRQVCELRFTGARTGRSVVLPVMYARHGDRLVILVGGAAQKTWWRNFTRPTTVQVLLAGAARTGTGHVVGTASPERTEAARVYAARFPGIPVEADPMVVIDLDSSA
jgi:F420H(2)-dependent quinone reductase